MTAPRKSMNDEAREKISFVATVYSALLISTFALILSWLSYCQSVEEQAPVFRFRYAIIEPGPSDPDPTEILREALGDDLAIVKNDLLEKIENSDYFPLNSRFFLIENVGPAYVDALRIKMRKRIFDQNDLRRDQGDLVDQPSIEVAGLKPGEFVAVPLAVESAEFSFDRDDILMAKSEGTMLEVVAITSTSPKGKRTEISVREQLENKIVISRIEMGG